MRRPRLPAPVRSIPVRSIPVRSAGSLLVVAGALVACGSEAPAPVAADGSVAVDSSAGACELSAARAQAGTVRFDVTNTGSEVTEFYLLAEDGLRVVAEVENVAPGLTRPLVARVPAGSYVTACKPGGTGEGIRADFTVTGAAEEVGVSGADRELVAAAEEGYAAYVRDQSDQLLVRTREFVDLYRDGDDAAARALYPVARTHWERIETVAESFGDLDPRMDAREADLEPGQEWTGWHLLEKDLWPARAAGYVPLSDAERARYAERLLADTETLDGRLQELTFTVDQVANGSRGLLEEVATGKVTGEEEYWSRTDLWDFQANVDGARVGFDGVRPLLERRDPALATRLADRFDALQVLLDAQRTEGGFRSYEELGADEVKELADAVNALAEPLSLLTSAVLS